MDEHVDSPLDNGEKIINWEEEAMGIINDVKTHVTEIKISDELPSCESKIYLNIRTIEDETYCVEVSSMGFRVVSNEYNKISDDKIEILDNEEIYETPYALLDKISPSYVKSFGDQLCKQLQNLQQMRAQFNEEDEDEVDGNST